ncbi:PREDICTED: protein Skeletor, isoforms B/C-like isoform X2 [Nicrophorus vespilloides]|uniref:Protein Skeletor, isoforms B/C-like isoform X2 n=1 Tax=Nicrophorus vespilloides TaxID=110193 RepID=A0ABM1NI72_NICVS|nr:PREDICTED: protein Skeletor, isoforms B/C-like isoform X2 [Nicrophorus vespilloides]
MAVSITNGRNLLLIVLLGLAGNANSAEYLGKFLGKLTELHHGVSGEVYAVDSRTLHIKDFTYDGQGPAAYFFAGNSRSPGNTGFRIRDENGSPEVLRRYRKEGVTITLPDGKTLNTIKWFSVWCEEFEVNFGDVKIPRNFDYPRPQKIDALRGVHAVNSDNIVIVDAQTLLVPNLSYDGEAPDAKFWVGSGSKPSPQGIRVPDENGKIMPLRKYDRKTVVLTLPGDLTVFDIGHFGIWCEAFTVDFGHVQVPQSLNIPPSLKMLGVSPQKPVSVVGVGTSRRPAATPVVGGGGGGGVQIEATTYRPRLSILRRSDQAHPHPLVNRDIYSQHNSIPQQQLLQQSQQQPQQQQQYQSQFFQILGGYDPQQIQLQPRNPVPYTPFYTTTTSNNYNQNQIHQYHHLDIPHARFG